MSKNKVDHYPVMLSAAMLFAIAVMPGAVAPGIVGAAADSMGLGETQLGLLIGLYFAGFGIVSATSYLWIRKVNWRVYSSIGVIMMGFSWILAGMMEGYPTLLLLMFVVGIGAGLFASPSITILGDGTEAENGFSWMIIFSVAGAAALLALFPIVTEISGFRGVTNLLGGSTLATLLLIPLIPVNNEKEEKSNESDTVKVEKFSWSNDRMTQPILALLVMALFCWAFGGSWAFFERIASYAALPAAETGQALAIGTLFGTIGAPLAAFFIKRIPMYYCYAITIASIAITLVFLNSSSLTSIIYLLLVCSFQFWINAGFCLMMAQTAEVDKIGRFVALIPAAQSLGNTIGAPINGLVLELSGVNAMLILTMLVFILGAIIFTYVDRKNIISARQ
ncbi:MAG TPA: MFS transporter [Woeseiaceae bacterium]|jgi:predicted MFS family arabinose efflux permease|nr:MFS transporter [Woeseiaceae bacterium]